MVEMNTIEVISVKSVFDFFTAIDISTTKLGSIQLWWRGQADSSWDLIPGIFRKEYKDKKGQEHNMINYFMHRATPRSARLPEKDDYSGWLFLMQHYGVPTRLLDWTESPLAALYFAVSDEKYPNSSGAVWGLSSAELNKSQDGSGNLAIAGTERVRPILNAAFRLDKGEDSKSKKSLAILANQADIRHMVQRSAFTIHGVPTPLNQLPDANKFLVRLEIPKEMKRMCVQQLDRLGITESMLFPDLEHLANEVKEMEFRY